MKYLVLLALLLPAVSFAASPDVLLSVNPEYPAPRTPVTVTAQVVGGGGSGALYTWLINDEVVARAVDQTALTLTAPELGDRTRVRLLINDEERSRELVIESGRVTIEWEGISERPPFYTGRSLLGGQGVARAQSIAELVRPDGTRVPESDIRYTWRIDGSVLRSESGIGRDRVFVRPPFYDNPFTLSVTAEGRGGQRAESSVQVVPVPLDVVLYETSPLGGVWDESSLRDVVPFTESELSVRAYPLSASDSPRLEYSWHLNNEQVPSVTGDKRAIVFKKTGSGRGLYDVSLEISSASSFLDKVGAAFQLQF